MPRRTWPKEPWQHDPDFTDPEMPGRGSVKARLSDGHAWATGFSDTEWTNRAVESVNAMAGVTRAEGVTSEEWLGAVQFLIRESRKHHAKSPGISIALARFELLEGQE